MAAASLRSRPAITFLDGIIAGAAVRSIPKSFFISGFSMARKGRLAEITAFRVCASIAAVSSLVNGKSMLLYVFKPDCLNFFGVADELDASGSLRFSDGASFFDFEASSSACSSDASDFASSDAFGHG